MFSCKANTPSFAFIKESIKLLLRHCASHHLNLAYYRGHYLRSTSLSTSISVLHNEEDGYYNPRIALEPHQNKSQRRDNLWHWGINLYHADAALATFGCETHFGSTVSRWWIVWHQLLKSHVFPWNQVRALITTHTCRVCDRFYLHQLLMF